MIPRIGGDAVAWCREHRTWPAGYCLKYVRSAHGIGSRYPTAISAWYNAAHRHSGDHRPPPGVPVFLAGGRYGHVAVSAGGGLCWSTDAVAYGRVDLVGIDALAAKWGYQVLGWTEDLNGVRVYYPPVIDASRAAAATRARGTVAHGRLLKRALAAEVGRGLMRLSTHRLGGAFRRRYRRWQTRLGYTGDAADGIPGIKSLRALGARHHFDVKE